MADTNCCSNLKCAVSHLIVIKVLSVPGVPFFDILAALVADGKVIKVVLQLKVRGTISTAAHTHTL
jgi:hypothetical protein